MIIKKFKNLNLNFKTILDIFKISFQLQVLKKLKIFNPSMGCIVQCTKDKKSI